MEQETKISELTGLPGALDPAALLAIVQGGVTYHATGEQVSNMVLGNISVVENANGLSIRVPVVGIQICAYYQSAPVDLDEGTPPNVRSASQRWDYPQVFAEPPIVVGSVHIGGGHAFGVRFDGLDATGVNYRLYSTSAGTAARAACIAVGRY